MSLFESSFSPTSATNHVKYSTINEHLIRSKVNYLEFGILDIVICLVFVFCYLKFFITETRTLTPETLHFLQ